MTVFEFLFGCCFRGRSSKSDSEIPNERSRLIPASVDTSPPISPSVMVIDHDRLKDKLGTIIRAKEGKMVNVNAAVPFNLHNKRLANPEASSSRSASGSNRHRPLPTSSDNIPSLRSDITHDAEGQNSLSFSPARSISHSSLRSYSRTPDDSAPILNARLVSEDAAARDRGRRGSKFRNSALGASADSPNQSLGNDSSHEPQPPITASPPALAPPFVIQDAGHLSISWDD